MRDIVCTIKQSSAHNTCANTFIACPQYFGVATNTVAAPRAVACDVRMLDMENSTQSLSRIS